MVKDPTRQPITGTSVTINWVILRDILAIGTIIATIAFSHGTIMARLDALDSRVARFERAYDTRMNNYETRNNSKAIGLGNPFGAKEAIADTSGERYVKSTTTRATVNP